MVSTHSPDFLNAIEPGELFVLSKKNGYTTISGAADNELVATYFKEGEKLGYLWKQGFFNNSSR